MSTTASKHPFHASTLLELLRERAIHQPDLQAYSFLPNGEVGEEERYTYAKLDQQARAIAAHLQELGLEGERVLLLYPPGLEYIAAFFGCLYAGVTTVPIYPPRSHKPTGRLQAIVADTQAKVALSTSLILAGAEQWLAHTPDLQALKRLATDTIQVADAERWREPSSIGEETLAFLQYTSGSTSTPKGVMLTHGNLLYNSALIYQGFELNQESRGVSWLPPYHDMGLIGGILQPLYCGIPVTLMSPVAFLQSPLRWLQAVAHTGATVSGGPNFAYELCVRKISPEQRAELDLSSWRVAFCGAEPIRYETLEHFAEAFKPCSFHWESFYPCYGLAEATLIVSGGKQVSPPVVERFQKEALEEGCVVEEPDAHAEAQTFVGCGKALGEQAIVIVEPESALQCADDQVGEIWVAGPSVARGYWKRPDETKNTFQAHLADTDEGPFLRTGDLGFLRNGELFVTGRIKDLIIIRGRNYYPQDIELAVEQCHPALRPGCGAAFSVVKDGEERLVIIQEVARHHQHADAEEVASAVRKVVAEQFELQVYDVVLIKTGSLPKTSSGKIQRYLCRERYLASSLDIIGSSILDATPAERAQGDSEQPNDGNYIHRALAVVHDPAARHALLTLYLQDQASRILHMSSSQVNAHSALSTFGIDSLMAIELKNEIETDLGVILPVTTLFQDVNISQLATEVLALLDRSDGSDEALSGRPIPHEAPPDEYPLSQGQRALWFLYRLAPDSAAYNITCAIRIHAELDVAALGRAFEKLIERHAPLRTVFASTQGEPVQRTLPASPVRLHQEEVANETSLQERLAVEAHRPFNLEEGPVLRVSLFTCAAQEHVLMLVVHHIVADFWSLVILMRELGTLYATEKAHVPPSLPSLQVHYADYVHWQADMLSDAEGERHWNYWQQQLAGDLPVLNLPADHPRPTLQRYQGANYHFELDEELTQRIKSLCQRENVTLYMILLAAFQVLLHRYTGQDDILVGTPAAGRNRAQLSGLIGYFVNTIVLRAHPDPQMSFKLFLEQIRQAVLEAFDHQDYPFPLLVERLQPRRNPSHSPIFQAMFALQKAPQFNEENLAAFAMGEAGIQAQWGDLPVESLALDQQIAQFDISLMMAEVQGRLTGLFQYNTDLFEGERMERMGQHYQRLLQALVAAPEQRIAALPLLSEPERLRLLQSWKTTHVDFGPPLCIHQLIEQQAAQRPLAEAVVCGEERMSYAELNRRANQLAHLLQKRGVGPEVLVGLCVERSLEMVVGMLAILKAGGAYVPLDPAYPGERLAFMLQDTQVEVLLTQERLREQVPQQGVQLVCLDADWAEISQESEANPSSAVSVENLAYVIYTSGSTGRPKGVAIAHHSAVTLLRWAAEIFAPEELAGVLAGTSTNFDLSVFELFLPLSRGGTVILAENTLYLSAIPADRVTLVNTVPSVMTELLRTSGLPDAVSVVNLAGEPLPNMLAQHIYQQSRVQKVYNLYGPSEDTTYSTFTLVQRGDSAQVPIGRPISNTYVYLLDAQGQPVPQGVPGELTLGGAGLARGYLHRPALTAEKFVPDPFSGQAGARLYRTGDLARSRRDGSLEFLGRLDHQVKLRGYRIELGEIESVLAQHRGVSEVVALVREDAPAEPRLVAYLVGQGEQPLHVGEVREYARGRLPAYMVPSSFVVLAALPLTPNGKVDRQALPRPQESRELFETSYVAPRTPLEERLVAIWQEVLGVKQVGIYDNFFDLGGHSLLATQVISQVRKIFQVGLPLRFLFEEPTVANLAEHVEAARQEEQSVQEDTIHPAPQDGNAPLSFAQQRLWFFDQFEPNSAAYNMPAAVRLRGGLDVPVLERSLSEIVRRHKSLRTTISSEKGHPVQIISPPVSFSLPTVDLQAIPEAEREAQLQAKLVEEIQRPFNLHEGPLLRAVLLKLAEQEHVLVVTMHHIISDGWSMGVFIRELSQLYPVFAQGQESPLPELPIQYADYATWQRQWLQGVALQEQLDFWKQLLGEAPAVLNLPTDHPRPSVQTFQGTRQALRLSEELSESLKQFSRQEGVTLFMTLLTAFGVLLARYSGQDDLLIGTPIANRNRREVEGLIGFFVNTLVLRCDLRGSPGFREALQRVREMALGAYAHQELPFEKLVEALQPERDLSRTPLFQVFFNMLTFTFDHVTLPGIQTEILAAPEVEAKFDMTLYVREEGTNILFELVYNANLFDQQRMSEMLDQLRLLLTQVVEQPGENISHYSLVSERAKAILPTPTLSLTSAWTGAVHERFAEQSRRQPKNVAVTDAQEFWGYEELEARSNQLANYLQAQHIAPQDVVAVYGHRSASLIWALLGILKAGAAFAILDPTYPALRLVANLRLAQPRGWIQLEAAGELPEAISSSLPEFSLRCCLTLPRRKQDVAQTPLAAASIDNPRLAVGQDDLAYVAFTSGTTGAPRGLLGTHGPLAHFLDWDCQAFDLHECDRFSMLSGLAHDPLLRDIFMPLWIGAALVVPDPAHTRSTHELVQWMRQEKVSVAHLTPTLGKLLTGTVAGYSQSPPENRRLSNLRYAFFGGDRLTKQDVLRFRQLAPVATLVNFYGATETPQAMSYFVVPEQAENLSETIPVGRGIQDVQLLILNESHCRAGIGEVGEIYVRTPHLTKGYIGDDALTNKRYLVNPFTHLPIDRLYKTGDRGWYLPDGNVEFLGRADDQVKIRGYRVEIAEIQVLLQHHPAIKDAAVLVLEEEAGDNRLVAYVVPDGHEAMDVSELRTYVKQRLPDYMVPSSFIPLDALPLTPNGKVDRRALPKPDGERPDVGISYVAPQTELEQTLAKIWQQVLHLDRVGAQDNFFDLGGHSLLLVEVQNEAQEVLKRDVSLIDLFQYPTISSLAKYLSQQHAEGPTFQDVQDRVRNRREVRSRRKQLYEKELKTHE